MSEDQRKRISIVDDDISMLELYQTILRERYKVYTTPDPNEFLKHLQESSPDLLIIDILMPVLNGLEVLHSLKQQYDIPIIAISGCDSGVLQGEAKYLANVFISKPFKPMDLINQIEENIDSDL